jgi:hypothetical protein
MFWKWFKVVGVVAVLVVVGLLYLSSRNASQQVSSPETNVSTPQIFR